MNILAINPPIVDFAAYDFWLKPYGFLVILEFLKKHKINITYIDCLDKKIKEGSFGRGKYFSQIIEKPSLLKSIPRHFKKYGLPSEEFKAQIKNVPTPDYILITSSMTYWYPAIQEQVKILKELFPKIPIILGGTYATLCYEHAVNNINCEEVIPRKNLYKLFQILGVEYSEETLLTSLPNYESYYKNIQYIILRTSWGCPFGCSYCAISNLHHLGLFRIPIPEIISYIKYYANKNIKNFVLYDDAFLYHTDYVIELLENIKKLKLSVNFHTPNALHLRFLTVKIAKLLKETGFINPHFGLETLDKNLQKDWGDKVNYEDLLRGVDSLKRGGYREGEFSVYLLLGYPDQDMERLKKDAQFINSLGAKVSLSEFSPVPGTKLFERYKEELKEPLLHNNSIFSFFVLKEKENIQERLEKIWEVKNYVRELNKKFSKF